MDEEPAACMDEVSRVACRVVALARADIAHLHLTGWQQVHAWLRPVAQSDVTTDGSDGEHAVVGEVFEEGAVGRADGELLLGELGNDAEVAHLVAAHQQ